MFRYVRVDTTTGYVYMYVWMYGCIYGTGDALLRGGVTSCFSLSCFSFFFFFLAFSFFFAFTFFFRILASPDSSLL